ncbi:MAG: ribosome biogenesis/translation initiation ATPase RLI [archaeon]
MRIAVIDKTKCQPRKCNFTCISVCPGVKTGKKTIVEENNFPVIYENLCIGCGICVKKCPFNAIKIENLAEEKGYLAYRYGKNGFGIFNLPIPDKGVGVIIGSNGIGKTTTLKILSGSLKVDFQNFPKQAQDWLKEERSVVVKPQELKISKKEKVKDVILRNDERKVAPEIIKKLELNDSLDKDLDELSGGELQRVAIACACCKKAEFYFFDEPCSFLDIKQRLNVAEVLKDLSKEANVLVIEHDLAVLDYLADYVYIIYGKPGVFGVCSNKKNARVGVNEYLFGFLKSENVRIRDFEYTFEKKPPASEWKGKKYVEYPSFEKKWPSFELKVEGGRLIKGEVVGLVGPNAIGKTTFVRVLAGEIDIGKKIDLGKVAYKPQYLNINSEKTVFDFLNSQKLDQAIFEETKSFVSELFDKQVNTLSGGELQRVAIVNALCLPSEICLLDEPSAYLDIEQRISLAKLIKKITEKTERISLVVDHDISFIDSISNRLIVFNGEPGKKGFANAPVSMREGMNSLLKNFDITFRRDKDTGRPRMNKKGSQKDIEQKKMGEYYYVISE